jgi:hypothetical protein
MSNNSEIIANIKQFQKYCIDMATGTTVPYEVYENSRNNLFSNASIKSAIPDWVVENRYGSQYWKFIKSKYPTYEERRIFLRTSFDELIEYIEGNGSHPISISVQEIIESIKEDNLESIWRKINLRKESDIDGAITAARSMVETTLKYILDQEGETYTNKDDLNDLYKKVANQLNLSPSGHNEQLFKKILGGVTTVVQGFGEMRNSYGDAHGKGKINYKAESRHATLTVNLAGSICSFLLHTHSENKQSIV